MKGKQYLKNHMKLNHYKLTFYNKITKIILIISKKIFLIY